MIVLDCSAALEIAKETPLGIGFSSLMLNGEEVIAPSLMRYETCNAVWKYTLKGMQPRANILKVGKDALALVDNFVDCDDIWEEVFHEAARLQHPAYDVFYLVLTRRQCATLFTADKELQKLCIETGVNCVYLDEDI